MPGHVIAIGFFVLLIGWLIWELWRAPLLDDDQQPVEWTERDDLALRLLFSDEADVPHERRHGR